MNATMSIGPEGVITFWNPEPTGVQALWDALNGCGFGDCTPNPRSDRSALESAVKDTYGSKNRIIQPRKKPTKHGIELVDVERNEDRNYYTTNFGAKVQDG